MKKALLFSLSLTAFNIVTAQVPSNCTIPPLLAAEYNRDIKQLATYRLFEIQSPDTALVTIPQKYIDTIEEALAAIFNASSIPERDTVFNLYCVHNHNGWPYDYAGFLVKVDTSYSWTQAWQNLNTMTGNPFMDALLTKYYLHIDNFYNWSIGNYAELSTDSSWNILALMDSIETVAGVISAESNYIIGEAGVISYSIAGDERYFNFYFEFNDCFDGCDNYREWQFKVNSDCSVEYLGYTDWGVFGISPPPAPINCNIFTSVEENIQAANWSVFPNPADDNLTIKTECPSTASTYTITDLAGRKILTGRLMTSLTYVDLVGIPAGIYLLQIDNKKINAIKVVKK